ERRYMKNLQLQFTSASTMTIAIGYSSSASDPAIGFYANYDFNFEVDLSTSEIKFSKKLPEGLQETKIMEQLTELNLSSSSTCYLILLTEYSFWTGYQLELPLLTLNTRHLVGFTNKVIPRTISMDQ